MNSQEMLEQFSNNQNHAKEVARLSLMLFDEANLKIKEMSNRKREYLQEAVTSFD